MSLLNLRVKTSTFNSRNFFTCLGIIAVIAGAATLGAFYIPRLFNKYIVNDDLRITSQNLSTYEEFVDTKLTNYKINQKKYISLKTYEDPSDKKLIAKLNDTLNNEQMTILGLISLNRFFTWINAFYANQNIDAITINLLSNHVQGISFDCSFMLVSDNTSYVCSFSTNDRFINFSSAGIYIEPANKLPYGHGFFSFGDINKLCTLNINNTKIDIINEYGSTYYLSAYLFSPNDIMQKLFPYYINWPIYF